MSGNRPVNTFVKNDEYLKGIAASIAENDLFCKLTKEQRYLIAQTMVPGGRAEKGDYLIDVAKKSDQCFYILLSGTVVVSTLSKNNKVTILNVMEQGASFGELALLDGGPRSANVVCMSDICTYSILNRANFQEIVRNHPEIMDKLLTQLCKRVRALSIKVEELATLDVPARLACTLLALVDGNIDPKRDGPYTIKHVLKQQELASMVGSSRETVSRILAEFRDEKIIDFPQVVAREKLIGQKNMVIVNVARLQEIAATVDNVVDVTRPKNGGEDADVILGTKARIALHLLDQAGIEEGAKVNSPFKISKVIKPQSVARLLGLPKDEAVNALMDLGKDNVLNFPMLDSAQQAAGQKEIVILDVVRLQEIAGQGSKKPRKSTVKK